MPLTKIYLLIFFLLFKTFNYAQVLEDIKPDFATLQFAGSIGYLSMGTGYNIFTNKGRVSVHYGTVPRTQGGLLHVASAKFIFNPALVPVSRNILINPIDVGVMISYHNGDDFRTIWPAQVDPRGYYWWPTALRAHLVFEHSVSCYFKKNSGVKRLTAYFESNINDLYLVSYVSNIKSINPFNLIKSGVGLRLYFSNPN